MPPPSRTAIASLFYLKCAYDTFASDKAAVEVCIQLAEALKKRGRYVEAISFWHKAEVVRPDDELPKREIATLTVMLQQSRDGKFDGDRKPGAGSAGAKAEELSHEQRLLQRLRRNPKDLAGHDELAGLYMNDEKYDKAVEVLNQKLEAVKGTDQETHVLETIEDVHLKVLRSKWIAADAKAKKSGKEADAKEVPVIRAELMRRDSDLPYPLRALSEQPHLPLRAGPPLPGSTATSPMRSVSCRWPRPTRGNGASACCISAIALVTSSNTRWQ